MKNYKTTNKTNAVNDMFDTFTQMIIDQIESIQNDWKRPWLLANVGTPQNFKGREYNGLNSIFLWLLSEKEGYKYPLFATFTAINEYNKNATKENYILINKGAKSFPVFFYKMFFKDSEGHEITSEQYDNLSKEAKENIKTYCTIRLFRVFNIEQTNIEKVQPELFEKLTSPYKRTQMRTNNMQVFEPLDNIIKEQSWICPINEKEQNGAYYSPKTNDITIPLRTQFLNAGSFASTCLHEMAHSTGHKDKLNRLSDNSYNAYAKEELIAELSAALTCAQYGIDSHIKEDSLPYIKGWLKNLKEEPNYLKTILSDVKKVNNLLKQHINVYLENIEEYEEEVA